MRLKKILLISLLLLPSLTYGEGIKREMRAAWLATVMNIDWPSYQGTSEVAREAQQQGLIDYLDGFQATGMNAVCIQVRSMCDAMYESSYEPWSVYLTGERGLDPGWDPLAFAVEECHKRGLECHAWVNPYRFSRTSINEWNTDQDEELKASGILLTYGKITVLNPGLEASRQRIVNVCQEIIEKYDVDGIIFDDYFYPDGIPTSSTAPDYQLWRSANSGMTFGDWRRANVNQMVADVWNMIQSVKPQVRFSIGPAGVACTASTSASKHGIDPCPKGSDWQYNTIFSDPVAWLEEGTIDYISPQIYWKTTHATNPYGPITEWWSYAANHYGRHHYSSQNIYFMDNDGNTQASWDEIVTQVRLNRQYNMDNAPGVVFYSSRYLNGPSMRGLGAYLRKTVFTNVALPPAITWKQREELGSPTGMSRANNRLSWNAVDRPLVKYAVYAVPSNVTVQQAQSESYDGIKADYLQAVVYSPSYSIPEEQQVGYWHAVAIVDGYNNEFAPTYIEAPDGEAQKVQLLNPIGGAQVQWHQQFSWTEAENAHYTLQIARDEDFSEMLIEQKLLTENNADISLNILASATTYYWRVITTQAGKLDKASDAETFVTQQRDYAPVAILEYPSDSEQLDDNFKFRVNPDGAASCDIEVSASPDFSALLSRGVDDFVAADNGKLEAQCIVAYLGTGMFYWRVRSHADGCDDSLSEVRSFTITDIKTGKTEPGYVVKQDIDTYSAKNGVKVSSDWLRSVSSSYANISFDGSGAYSRSMAVLGDYVYVAERDKNSSTAACALEVYSAATGEWVKKLSLSSDVQGNYFPCNNVMTDDAGHLLVGNMVLKINTTALTLHEINTTTGAATLRASVTSDVATGRIDHFAVTGDVSSGNFTIVAAIAKAGQLVKWTFENGEQASHNVVDVTEFCPATATSFGTAPHIVPAGSNVVWVDGGSTYFTKYDISTGAMLDSFESNTEIKPAGSQANGGAPFALGTANFLVFNYGDYSLANGHQYLLAMNRGATEIAGYQPLWTLPKAGIGMVNSTTMSAPCTVILENERKASIYMFVAGNALAKYTVELAEPCDVNGDGQVTVSDVTAVYNVILGSDDTYRDTADVNGDGQVTVGDVTELYNSILGM